MTSCSNSPKGSSISSNQFDLKASADNSLYLMAGTDSLRVALLVYRGNPHSGGQGVYTRYVARELVNLGHQVTEIGRAHV